MKRYSDPMRALDAAKIALKHKGFGVRHIVRSGHSFRVVNPRLDPAHYGLKVAELYHPTKE